MRASTAEPLLPSMAPTHILGISAYYHDSAACLLRDGEIIAAGQEERFTRKKGDPSFPARVANAITDGLERFLEGARSTADLATR